MSKVSKKCEFSSTTRKRIKERDKGCIFCRLKYHTDECKDIYLLQPTQIMHYIPRSHQGLGIEQNGAWGCIWHHTMLDNGNEGRRTEMMELFRDYLRAQYDDWDEDKLTYRKYGF